MREFSEQVLRIEDRLGYRFDNRELLVTALTHSSYVRGDSNRTEFNERLEFLGDAVLGFIIGEAIYRSKSELDEGDMTRTRAAIVNATALHSVAVALDIGSAMRMGTGEARSGGRTKKSILADAVEAIIGAIYIDGGIESAREFIQKHFAQLIRDSLASAHERDPKTRLQERIQREHSGDLRYELVSESGPAHKRTYVMAAVLNGEVLGTGSGGSKQAAGLQAAEIALQSLDAADEEAGARP
ncbi:MAG: ribonuclease III [Clostridia bacterium]|nr:ribonuclease III [Clostridia bacterium]